MGSVTTQCNRTSPVRPRAILLFLVLAGLCAAQSQPGLQIPRASRPPKLDDLLKGRGALPGAQVTGFRQREPGDGVPSSQETSAYLSYDAENLYVLFVCRDEPHRVRARMARREDIAEDDQVAVYLDTFHDRQRAYVFATNPLGVQLDGIITEGRGKVDNSFDTLWESEGRLTEDGFVARLAIPFKSLRFSHSPNQTWGIALGRSIYRNNEEAYWPLITRRVEGFVQQMAALEGLELTSANRNLQFIPSFTFARARFLDSKLPAFVAANDIRPSLDTKMVLRDAFTLDVTVNPDFSQVESDEPQVTVNRRFEVFYPEKRPFFLENAGLFETPVNLFFSRRIVDPQLGGRLTGKLGRWALGALVADDRTPGKLVAKTDPLYGSTAKAGAVRLLREFGRQSRIGFLATSRNFDARSNQVLSVDTRLKLNPNWTLTGQAAHSRTRRLSGDSRTGTAYFAELAFRDRHLIHKTEYTDFSPDFASELGFVRRVDIRQAQEYLNYLWRPERRRLVSFGPSLLALVNWDRQGRVQDRLAGAEFQFDLTGQTQLKLARYQYFELFQDLGFRKHTNSVYFYTGWLKRAFIYAYWGQGTSINYSPAHGSPPFLGDARDGTVTLTLRPTPRIRLAPTYVYSRLGAREGSVQAPGGAAAIFNNHIARMKLNYQLTRALSLRTIVDYYGLLPNRDLVAQQNVKQVTPDILLTYLINPFTALYIGYTDRYANVALDPAQPGVLRTGAPGTSIGRQFFIKLSYLVRL